MNDGVLQAVMGGAISALTFVLGALSNRHLFQREQQRVMTTTLYDRRIELYPQLWAITGQLRWSRMANDPTIDSQLRETLAALSAWHERAGLFLSKLGYRALMELMGSMDTVIEAPPDEPARGEMIRTVWKRKNTMRRVLRIDLGLLFAEDMEAEPPRR